MRLDPFLILMIAAVVLVTLFPATGNAADIVSMLGTIGVALLFFGHGAALSHKAIVSGLKQWQLHGFIFATTFIVFPLIVQPLRLVPESILPSDLVLGFIYLGVLPSAISSSIAYTAMARGNVPAAVCNSAGSNVFGLLLTPLLMTIFMRSSGSIDLGQALRDVVIELLLPFGLGQASHRWLGPFLSTRKHWLENYDQSVIVLIIYSAFSQSVTAGLWQVLPPSGLIVAIVLCVVLLAGVIGLTMVGSRWLGFTREDEIAAVFCGSKKSLASGLPLAQVLFAGLPGFGMIVLPIMLYNQIQILVGAVLARRYAIQLSTSDAATQTG
ncbi:bile acid:sodium symporter [Ochrobactrum pecoris]|uniref:Bile acid:sodium symporter n=1 Tax=Brucella pecoris TaxID=867683 RepID=A0A5C5CIL4_9HYPH|nr:bile acid:sodium symporter family protein [Brucella pecoris]MBB4095243.1 sodium/bile acid cotransporter 7 [Brucella pecoris]NKW81626.1 bile acid:sodium symporter [Brucella pecoris]TNV10536.1 bile acid:sodium symporter [Brucella pecoris]